MSVGCPTCGVSSPDSARFCSNCGARLPVGGDSSPSTPAVLPAERRRVTILFGDLTDFTGWAEDLDPERVGSVTNQVLAACALAVTDYGGHVDKLTGDGIMAIFGAPVAHEDDAARAVKAALAMQAAVIHVVGAVLGDRAGVTDRADQLGLRVGLNTGVVLAGVQASLTYTVVGDAVNTASRLADVAAVGAVLAGRETALATMGIASWRALPALTLKGKRETVSAYELIQLRADATQEGFVGPIFGREREIGLLVGAVVEVSETRVPVSIYVSGEAGSGKTRLLTECAGFVAELPGARVLWGRCAPYGVGRDLLPLVSMLRAALGLRQAADADLAFELRAGLVALERDSGLSLTSPGLAESLLGLLGVTTEGAGSGALPQGAARPEHPKLAAELDAAAAVFRAVGSELLVLVIDDLQWASPALHQAVAALADRLSGPVAIVGAGRSDDEGDAATTWWDSLPNPMTIELHPLADPAVLALLRSHLAGASVTPQVTTLLLSRAQGNPFFLEELLQLLIDTAVLTRDADGGWVVASDVPVDLVPVGVQAVLSARMDALPAGAKAVLRDASVLGTTAPLTGLEVLTQQHGGDPAQVPAMVELLVERRLLVPVEGGAPSYSFIHALARDVAYAAIPKADRALAHAWSARWAAEVLPAGAESDQSVATHADRAVALATEMGLPPGAGPWTVRSIGSAAYGRLAASAVGRDDHRTAVRLFTRSLELSDAAAPVLSVQVALASELVALRHTGEAELLLPEALASGDPGTTAGARLVLGEIRRQQARDDEATSCWVSAFALASEAGVDRIAGEAIRNLGLLDYFAGRLPAAEEHFATALDLARRIGDLRGVGWAHQHLALSQSSRGAFAEADRALLDAARVFADLEDVGGLAWCAGTEALVRVLQGRLTEGRALIAGLLPAADDLGDHWVTAACLTIDALAAAELGDLEFGLRGATRAAEMFGALDDHWGEVLALAAVGIALRGLGRYSEATEVLTRALHLVEGTSTAPLTRLIALSALGTVSLEQGDLAVAESATTQAEALLARIPLSPGARVAVTVLRGQLSRAKGDLAGAEQLLLTAAAVEDRDAMLFPKRQTLAHLAGVRLERGDVTGARAAASEALMTPAEDIRSRVLALRALGSVRKAEGDERGAKAAWQEALAIAHSSEASAEREATQRLLDSV